jgi:hypothetical protein
MIKFPEWCTDGRIYETLCDFGIQLHNVKIDKLNELKEVFYRSLIQDYEPDLRDYTLREIKESVDARVDQVIEKYNFKFTDPALKVLGTKWNEVVEGKHV